MCLLKSKRVSPDHIQASRDQVNNAWHSTIQNDKPFYTISGWAWLIIVTLCILSMALKDEDKLNKKLVPKWNKTEDLKNEDNIVVNSTKLINVFNLFP